MTGPTPKLRRPAPGAPFDKRLTPAKWQRVRRDAGRPFNPAEDVDFFDAVEDFVNAVAPGGAVVAGQINTVQTALSATVADLKNRKQADGPQFADGSRWVWQANGTPDGGTVLVAQGGGVWRREYSGPVDARWFGVRFDDPKTDYSAPMQRAIDSGAAQIICPPGVVRLANIVINRPLSLIGCARAHHANIAVNNGLALADLPREATVIICGNPAQFTLNLRADSKLSGVKVAGFGFFQEHAAATPTAYRYCISDEASPSYWSGVELDDLIFFNTYDAISLTHAERVDIGTVFGDFLHNGIVLNGLRDVSTIKRLHGWNFSRTPSFDDFRRSNKSGWLISADYVDELWCHEIFAWDRYYGGYFKQAWAGIQQFTTDRCAQPLKIEKPHSQGIKISQANLICTANDVQPDAAVYICGEDAAGNAVVQFNQLSVFYGGGAYGPLSCVRVDNPQARVQIDQFNPAYFARDGLRVDRAESVQVGQMVASNYVEAQTSLSLDAVLIRNNAATARLSLNDVDLGVDTLIRYVYDGFFDPLRVSLPPAPASLPLRPSVYVDNLYGGGIGSGIDFGLPYLEVNSGDGGKAGDWTGLRIVPFEVSPVDALRPGSMFYGLMYRPVTDLVGPAGDARHVAMPVPNPAGEDALVPIRRTASSTPYLLLMRGNTANGGKLNLSNQSRSFSGKLRIYRTYMFQAPRLALPQIEPQARATAKPDKARATLVGDFVQNSQPDGQGVDGARYIIDGWLGRQNNAFSIWTEVRKPCEN